MKESQAANDERNAIARLAIALHTGRDSPDHVVASWTTATDQGTLILCLFQDGEVLMGMMSGTGNSTCPVSPADLAQHIEDCRQALAAMPT